MTTEYVSVPREFLAVLEAKISRWRYLASENASGTEGELSFNVTLHSCARELEAILSRATPSDDSAELNYAKSLATSMWEKHYAKDAPNWELCDDLYGVLSQIDNMLTGLSREKTSTPRVVSDADVERACEVANKMGAHSCTGGMRKAAMRAALESFANSQPHAARVELSDDDVERLSLQAGWEGNRKYMTIADFHIWCDRMRAFAKLAAAPTAEGRG